MELSSDPQTLSQGIPLPLADALDIVEIDSVLSAADNRVIAIVGPAEAGKTSLLAAVYDQFQTGVVGTLQFARSRTLQAFELVCHDARAESRRGVPHSERTRLGEVKFYHVEVRDGASLVGLVFADRSGEEYRELTADVEQAANLPEVHRSDKITVLVDGSQMADVGARHNARANTLMILQALKDGGAIGHATQSLSVVLTKADAIIASGNAEQARSDFHRLVRDIRSRFGTHFESITPFEVAASPTSSAVERGRGLNELIAHWANPLPPPKPTEHPTYVSLRTFGRLSVSEIAE